MSMNDMGSEAILYRGRGVVVVYPKVALDGEEKAHSLEKGGPGRNDIDVCEIVMSQKK